MTTKIATNLSLEEAKRIKVLSKNSCLISILDLGWDYQLDIPQSDNVLFLTFSDIRRQKMTTKDYQLVGITNSQAKQIHDFCEKNSHKSFIVHCHAGISRSAAVCLYLNLKYGHKLKDFFFDLSAPNPFVLMKLLKLRFDHDTI